MPKFHPLKVSKVDRPTSESVALTFAIEDHLKGDFRFIQGQHLTLKADINGEDTRRSYSICSCPLDGELTVAIKKIDGGVFSTFAHEQVNVGDEIEVMPPHGSFHVPLSPENERSYVAFASGSGITPIISIIETTLRSEPKSEFTLFYGNRRTASIIFQERLEALKNKFMGRFSLYHVLSKERQESELFNGRITRDKIASFGKVFFDPTSIDHYFTCGPENMMLDVRDQLIAMGVEENRIHLELFTSPVGKLGTESNAIEREKAKSEITIILDGNSLSFPYDSDASILDVAFENGADLPYACKGGVCSTCVARVEKGEVSMDVNYALEPDELAKGLVLTCQSHPKTPEVTLSFDV